MEARDTKGKIVKETFPAEIVTIVGDILAGVVLSLLILPFDSFLILILIVPALLSMRGNISGPFIARSSRDLIIGQSNKKLNNPIINAVTIDNKYVASTFSIQDFLLN